MEHVRSRPESLDLSSFSDLLNIEDMVQFDLLILRLDLLDPFKVSLFWPNVILKKDWNKIIAN